MNNVDIKNTRVDREQWDTVITAKNGIFNINLKEIFHYRDLLFLFVKRDFVAFYKQTILGPLWYLLQPLLTTIVFTIIFGNIAKISTDGIPRTIFYMSGIVIWNYFSKCLVKTSNTFLLNKNIFGKVYYPRLIMPISNSISEFIAFLIQFLLFIIFFIYFWVTGTQIKPTIWILILPLLVIHTALLGVGVGVLISSLTTKYRDLKFLVTFGVQLWMYATPIVYPMSQIPDKWKIVFIINPMAAIVETFRYIFLGTGDFDLIKYGISLGATLIIFFISINMFGKVEKTFMDKI